MGSREERDKKREDIAKSIVTSSEALEILGLSRMRLSKLAREGRITPISKGIYLKDDILAFKDAPRRPGRPTKEEGEE